MPIAAHFEQAAGTAGQARDPRRTLRLDALGATDAGTASVLIHNISSTGLLLECQAPLAIAERIEIDLPRIGATWAQVVWNSGNLSGCQFDTPVSAAALSAAQLRSVTLTEPEVPAAPPPEQETFGARLHRLRAERGLTLSHIATHLGVSKPTVWAWEQGKARPVESRIDALAEAIGVTRADLMPGTIGPIAGDLITRSREQIARAVGTTPDKVRIMIEL
jgi:transcriptional regulator with XRE-family HTH domain